MPLKGYAAGPLKQIESMERKAKKIMTEPQNSDTEAAKNAFHRNHSSTSGNALDSSSMSDSVLMLRLLATPSASKG